MNDVMSFGIHRIWKNSMMDWLSPQANQKLLDLAGGTGDLTIRFSHLVGPQGRVILADINESMMKVGRDRLIDKGIVGNVSYVQANAEALPFPDNTFDCITIAFGLRNVTDKDKALVSMCRYSNLVERWSSWNSLNLNHSHLNKFISTRSTYYQKLVSSLRTMKPATAIWQNLFVCIQTKSP